MRYLVEMKENDIFCDSSMVAKKFGQKHDKVRIIIERLCKDLLTLPESMAISNRPKVITEKRVYRGREYNAFLMNRPFFSLLCMRFKGVKALEWQVKFNDAFYDMEKAILQEKLNKDSDLWLDTRSQGKLVRLETTDVIKEFVDYATSQGSKSAKFYYKHVTMATYKALGLMQQKQPKLRDTLNCLQLGFLQSAEYVAQKSLKKHMAEEYPYKLIYKHVCNDLNTFANSLMIGDV